MRVTRGEDKLFYRHTGERVDDTELTRRWKSAGVPPAYVRTCYAEDLSAPLIATGIDARGRRQYRYAKDVSQRRSGQRNCKLLRHAKEVTDKLDAALRVDTATKGGTALLSPVAAATETIRVCGMRPGSRSAFTDGVTTLHTTKHVTRGPDGRFQIAFTGKSYMPNACVVDPKTPLGAYLDDALTTRHRAAAASSPPTGGGLPVFPHVDASDINAYIREVGGHDLTAKDLRTWQANVLFLDTVHALASSGTMPLESKRQRQALVKEAVKRVATRLNNTPGMAKKAYIMPGVLEAALEDPLRADFSRVTCDDDDTSR